MILYIFYGFLIITTIVVVILAGKGVFTANVKSVKSINTVEPVESVKSINTSVRFDKPVKPVKPVAPLYKPSKTNNSVPYINPVPFHTGYLPTNQKPANLCCNDVMYPINPIYVNYGLPVRSDCDVNIFNSQP